MTTPKDIPARKVESKPAKEKKPYKPRPYLKNPVLKSHAGLKALKAQLEGGKG